MEAVEKVIEVTKQTLADEPQKRAMYPDNALDGFRFGACLDMRVRLAMELLTHSQIFNGFDPDMTGVSPAASEHAVFALDIASELFDLAEKRGLIEAFKDFENDEHLKGHVKRQVAYAFEQEKEKNKQFEEANRIATAVHNAFGNRNQ